MLTLNKRIEELLGTGLSVKTITERLGITFDKLCEELNEHPELLNRMKALYPKYDFTCHAKKEKTRDKKQPKEAREDIINSETVVKEDASI